jgi:hypothetical protein
MPARPTAILLSSSFVVVCLLYGIIWSVYRFDATAVSIGSFALIAFSLGVAAYLRDLGDRSLFIAQKAAKMAEIDVNALLHNLLPSSVVRDMLSGAPIPPRVHRNCGILFADLAGFTKMSSSMTPQRLMEILNTIYSHFDRLVEQKQLWKVRSRFEIAATVG